MQKYGIIIMSGFAALWFAWGMSAITPMPLPWLLVPLAISGAMIALATRLPVTASKNIRENTGKIVGWASGLEGVAILLANNVAIWTGHPNLVVCATMAIVGLHFLPLAYFLGIPSYYLTGTALVALALTGLAIPTDTARLLVLCLGAATLLWITCLTAFLRTAPMHDTETLTVS